jgi:plastocyanin
MPSPRSIRAMAASALVAGAVAAALPAGPAAAGTDAPTAVAAKAKTYKVEVGSDYYDPKKLTIRKGDTVQWNWAPSFNLHDVATKKGAPEKFRSPTQSSGTYKHTFRKPGTFVLICTKHSMTMKLVVKR